MELIRRRLASCALALTAVQLALLFMAPVSACCKTAAAAAANARISATEDAPDCCPPGAHRDGECPVHQKKAHCRMSCDHTSAAQLIVGAIGIVPWPSAVVVPSAESAAPVAAPAIVPFRSSVPAAPPPRLL
jgi:hypothetical protein